MSTQIDVLSATGLRTGEVLTRGEIHRLGKRHRAVRLYWFNAAGELLLQRRAATVDHGPNLYSISVVGHVAAGESSAQTMRRELEEELGVDASTLSVDFLFSHYQEATLRDDYVDRQFNDIYVTRGELDLATVRFDPHEVAEVKFVPFADFLTMLADKTNVMSRVYGPECRDLFYFMRT